MKKYLAIIAAALLGAGSALQGAVLADASFDTDSYIYNRTNNSWRPSINLGESRAPGDHHFNFGVVEFDVSSLSTGGSKFLALTPDLYTFPGEFGVPVGDPSQFGSATVHVVALNSSFLDTYMLSNTNSSTWYNIYVQNAEPVGTIEFVDQGTFYLDVTSIVDSWINGDKANYGFALWASDGSVNIFSSESGFGPQLVSVVPEPSTYALFAGIAVLLGTAVYRRRRK